MKLKILAVILTAVLSLSGCQDADANSPTDYHETTITLGDAVALVGEGAVFDENMITIEKGGRYVVNGSHDQMMIVVDSKTEAATLVLNGVSLSNTEGPAILLQSGSDIVIELAEGTENFVADGGNSDYDGAIYGLVSYTIDGKGALTVQGNVNEGIASEENLTINDGIITVEAVDDGLNASHDGASQLTINDGQLLIKAGGDGIDSNGSLTINGGTIITMSPTTDMSGGIDADGEVLFNGGTIIASGGHNSLPSENSKQSSVLAVFADEQMAQSLMAIKTGEDLLIAFAPEKNYTEVLYSAANVTPNTTYEVYADVTGTPNAQGISETSEGGELVSEITAGNFNQSHPPAMGPRNGRDEPMREGEPPQDRPPKGERGEQPQNRPPLTERPEKPEAPHESQPSATR